MTVTANNCTQGGDPAIGVGAVVGSIVGTAVISALLTALMCWLLWVRRGGSGKGSSVAPRKGGTTDTADGTSGGASSAGNPRSAWTSAINEKHQVISTKNAKQEGRRFVRKESKMSLTEAAAAENDAVSAPSTPRATEDVMRRRSFIAEHNTVKFQVDDESEVCRVYEVALSELALLRSIGKGSYGQVYVSIWRSELVAVKKLDIR